MRNITCKTTPVSRALGHTAIGGAAYRAGENLKARGQGPDGTDKWFRYGNRSMVVRECFIMVPDGAPDYATDRSELWNRVEEMEDRKNARLGREVQLGFAYELSHDEQRALIKEFVQREFTSRGFVADVSIHNYGRTLPAMGGSDKVQATLRALADEGVPFLERDEAEQAEEPHLLTLRNRQGVVTGYKLYQPHCHVRITPRACADGEWVNNKTASRYFNQHQTAMNWRYEWPKLQNAYLRRAGFTDVEVRSTGDAEEAFGDLPRKAESSDKAIYHIEERSDQLSAEDRAKHAEAKDAEVSRREFNEIHNDTIRQAHADQRASARAGTSSEQMTRLAAWWRNASRSFTNWKDEWRDHARAFWQRITQGQPREGPDQ